MTKSNHYNRVTNPYVQDLMLSFEKTYGSLVTALINWEVVPKDFEKKINGNPNYPFQESLDEVVASVGQWVLELKKVVDDYYKCFDPTMTVGDLRKIIKDMDDSIQIVIGNPDGWYNNIESYEYPDGENYVALTLNMGDECHTRQF